MAIGLVQKQGIDFQPQPGVARFESPRPSWPAHVAPPAPRTHRISGIAALSAGAATLTIAVVYAMSNTSATPLGEHPVARLGLAAAIGVLLTAVHAHLRGAQREAFSLARAQTLLCVAGALTMILIDNSVARAFGIAGAASIVRFRTPVEDPTDAMVLFLLMGLGMACGIGSFAIALSGAAAVCLLLVAFSLRTPAPKRRTVTLELVGPGHDFPAAHVQRVLARYGVTHEPSEWAQDTSTRVKYRAVVDETVSLEAIGAELMNRGTAGLESVTWDVRKAGA